MVQDGAMKLKAWLDSQVPPLTQFDFAARIQRDPSTVTKWLKEGTVPDSTTMRRIIEETGGAVRPDDFYDLPADQKGALATQPKILPAASNSSKNISQTSSSPAKTGEAA